MSHCAVRIIRAVYDKARATDEELGADNLSDTHKKLRQLHAELEELRKESELDTSEAEAIFARLTDQYENALGLYELVQEDQERLKAENIRLRRIILAMLAELGITD